MSIQTHGANLDSISYPPHVGGKNGHIRIDCKADGCGYYAYASTFDGALKMISHHVEGKAAAQRTYNPTHQDVLDEIEKMKAKASTPLQRAVMQHLTGNRCDWDCDYCHDGDDT